MCDGQLSDPLMSRPDRLAPLAPGPCVAPRLRRQDPGELKMVACMNVRTVADAGARVKPSSELNHGAVRGTS